MLVLRRQQTRLQYGKISSVVSRFLSSQSDYKTLLLSYSGDDNALATVVLNRPKKKNAFSREMYDELGVALRDLSENKKVKVILLTAAGDNFSSGNDLSNFSQIMHPLTMAKQSREICYSFVDSFVSCKKSIVVAVNGPAFGIAVTVLGLCDRIFSSTTATYKTPFAELGQVSNICAENIQVQVRSLVDFTPLLGPKLIAYHCTISCLGS